MTTEQFLKGFQQALKNTFNNPDWEIYKKANVYRSQVPVPKSVFGKSTKFIHTFGIYRANKELEYVFLGNLGRILGIGTYPFRDAIFAQQRFRARSRPNPKLEVITPCKYTDYAYMTLHMTCNLVTSYTNKSGSLVVIVKTMSVVGYPNGYFHCSYSFKHKVILNGDKLLSQKFVPGERREPKRGIRYTTQYELEDLIAILEQAGYPRLIDNKNPAEFMKLDPIYKIGKVVGFDMMNVAQSLYSSIARKVKQEHLFMELHRMSVLSVYPIKAIVQRQSVTSVLTKGLMNTIRSKANGNPRFSLYISALIGDHSVDKLKYIQEKTLGELTDTHFNNLKLVMIHRSIMYDRRHIAQRNYVEHVRDSLYMLIQLERDDLKLSLNWGVHRMDDFHREVSILLYKKQRAFTRIEYALGYRTLILELFKNNIDATLIDSNHDLAQEGLEQSHCVGSYWPSVESGSICIMRLFDEDDNRYTAEICYIRDDGTFRLKQLRGFANSNASLDFYTEVKGIVESFKFPAKHFGYPKVIERDTENPLPDQLMQRIDMV